MSEYLRRPTTQRVTEDAQVTPLELFFDLVFVYALTQTTALMASNVSVEGHLPAFLTLAAAVAVLTVLVVVELWRDSGERYEIRHA